MTTTSELRAWSVPLCLTVALLSACAGAEDGGGSRWETPHAATTTSASAPAPDPTSELAPGTTPSTRANAPRRSAPAAPGAPRPDGDGARAPGAPRPEKSETRKAPGAPIRIPARVEDSGRDFDEVLGEIRAGITDQCGGTLCVTLTVQHDPGGDPECDDLFARTEPAQRSTVARGSTVTVVGFRPEDCATTPDPGGSPPAGPEGDGAAS